ncbi:hypothetical protein PInf_022136 [Phytophthora infestans]|nr:hypothetical protein PInf_022136 [Phytophthora infestans]
MENELIGQWRQGNVTPESVMKLLKLDNNVDDVLKSDNLRTLEKYIAELNRNNPSDQVTLLGVLTSKFGEAGVAKAILDGKAHGNSAWVSERLQKQQHQRWLDDGLTVDDVFTRLKLMEVEAAVYGRSVDALSEYISIYNKAKSKHETLMGTLARGFRGENELATKLLRARVAVETNAKATALQTRHFQASTSRIQKDVVSQFKKYYEGEPLQ